MPYRRRGAFRVNAWLVRCALGCPPAIPAVPGVRTVPGAASHALPGTHVTADVKMSEIAEAELTHLAGRASFTKNSWRCLRNFVEGGTSERDLRDERSGPLHPGDCRRPGHRPEHGSPVPEIAGGDPAQAEAAAQVQAGPLPGICRPAAVGGVGELRGAAPRAEGPGL